MILLKGLEKLIKLQLISKRVFFRNLKIGFYEDMLNRTEILNKKINEEIYQLEN